MAQTAFLSPPMPWETRRLLALHFPLWETDCLKRAEPALAESPRPLALYDKQKGAFRLVAADALGRAAGLGPGQMLADAQARVPDAVVRFFDSGMTESVFAALADWHAYVSPIVAVETAIAPYGDLAIDITGVSHLWGGEGPLCDAVTARLEKRGIAVQAAIAPTLGAAWGLARFRPGTIVADDPAQALASLPVAALRLDPETVGGLHQMGLKRVSQLYPRNRRALAARFGQGLLDRLDQALGAREERLVPRLPVPEKSTERRFAEPLGYLDDVTMTATDLAFALCARLERDGEGAQGFCLDLFRVDHKRMTLSVNAARATRDPGHVARLLCNRIERLRDDFDAGFGIEAIRLSAHTLSELESVAISALAHPDGTPDLDRLYDRIASRLGAGAVTRAQLEDTHIPERAVRFASTSVWRRQDDPLPPVRARRPLRLLPAPEPIEVVAAVPEGPPVRMVWRRRAHRLVRAAGPERIGVEWWRQERVLTRDYYVAEDEEGRRFWLFRDGLFAEIQIPRWFLHGMFS